MSSSAYAVDALELGGHKQPDAMCTTSSANDNTGATAAAAILADLPPTLRLAVKYSGNASSGMVAFQVAGSILNAAFPFLLFAGATGSFAIGLVFAILAIASNLLNLTAPRYRTPPMLLAVLRSQADEVAQAVRTFIVGGIIFFSGLLVIIFHFLVTPNIIGTQMFGEESYTVAVVLTVFAFMGLVATTTMGVLNMVSEKVMAEWCSRINAYLLEVQERLLKVADGANIPDVIAGLAEAQEKNEVWAREMNRAYSTQNGVILPMMLAWSFLPLAMIAIPTDDDTRLAQVVVLICFA